MSLSTQTNRTDHTENGVTTVFPFYFKIFSEADLVVISVDKTTLVKTTLSLGTDYTISGVNAESGSITKAAGTSGDGLVIKRVVDLTQPTVLRNQSDFFPATHEKAFDRIVMQNQQQQEELDRAVKFSPTSTSRGTMPEPVTGYAVGFDANGDLAAVPNTGADQTAYNTATFAAKTDLALIRSDLAATTGAGLVGYVSPSTEVVTTTTKQFLDHPVFANVVSDTQRLVDIINVARQGLGSEPTPVVIHSYTEASTVLSVDNVGTSNTILALQNGNNPTRRPDKASNFVGTGQFLACNKYIVGSGYTSLFVIDANGNIVSQANANFYGPAHTFGLNTTAATSIYINGTSGSQKSIFFQSAGVNRFQLFLTGNLLYIGAYDTGGGFIDFPFSLDATSGVGLTFARPMIMTKGIQYQAKAFTANGSATTFTYPANTRYQYITTSAASLATTLPGTSSTLDGMVITLVAGSSVATATWVAGTGGATIVGAPSSLSANVPVRFIYHHATTSWYPY